MNSRWTTAGVTAVLVMATGSAPALTAQQTAGDRYELGGDRVAIYNVAGQIEVVRGGDREVVVEVVRGGADADRLSVEVDRIQGRNALRVLYPDDQVVYTAGGRRTSTEMRVRDDGTFGGGWGNRGRRMRVRSSGSGLEAHADLRITIPAGRDVEIHLGVGSIASRDVDADLVLDTWSGRVEVEGHAGDLGVDTGSGDVAVSRARGAVGIDTGSGRVDLADIEGDEIHVDTGAGRVVASQLTARDVEVDTGSGRVELRRVDARNVLVDTGSGGVELELIADVDDVEIDTGSGGVVLRLPETLGARVEVDTGSDGIDVDHPMEVSRKRRGEFLGTAGDGRGRILIDTGSGGVRILSR